MNGQSGARRPIYTVYEQLRHHTVAYMICFRIALADEAYKLRWRSQKCELGGLARCIPTVLRLSLPYRPLFFLSLSSLLFLSFFFPRSPAPFPLFKSKTP